MKAVLSGIRVVTLATNVPGPVSAARLRDLGATILKVEPPDGDPLAAAAPRWYAELHRDVRVERLDLKRPAERQRVEELLANADLLITASRPSKLERLGLGWQTLHASHPRLAHVAIVGEGAPNVERAGHDLTYVARAGLGEPPALPRTLVADLGGAERAVSTALALLLQRERGGATGSATVALADAADAFAAPLGHGLTAPLGVLGGALPTYRWYRARDGWVAVAALEPHFARRLAVALGLSDTGEGAAATELAAESVAARFAAGDVATWEGLAVAADVPLTVLRDAPVHRSGP